MFQTIATPIQARRRVIDGIFDINLDESLSDEFVERFDVVFNHTTLEHIF